MDSAVMSSSGMANYQSSGVYNVDPFLKRQKIEDMPPSEFLGLPISDLNQSGPLVPGPGAKRDVAASILGVALPKLERRDQDDIARAKKYAMEQSIKYVLMKQTLAHQQQQAKSLQRHQALVLMCRVYIGSISFELREDTIRQAFAPFGPIKTINMSWDPVAQKHKGFAFVEYDLPEAAQLALEQMNGVMIGGRNIKCGRDTRIKFSHMDQVIDEVMDEAREYHRIYIASIHQDLTEDDIKSVFEAFGKIRSCKLAPGAAPGKHRGYGFIEYENAQSALESIASMNLFDLGGQYLRVGKAITPPNALQVVAPGQNQMPTAAAVAAAAATAKIQAMEAVTNTAAVLGLTKEPSTPPMAIAPPSLHVPTIIPTLSAYPSMVNPPQLITPKLGGIYLSSPISKLSSVPPPGVAIPSGLGGLPAPSVASTSGFGPAVAGIPPPTVAVPTAIGGVPVPNTNAFSISPVSGSHSAAAAAATANAIAANAAVKEGIMKKLTEVESENTSLSSQENMSIRGQSARHIVMQKLMRDESSPVIVLKNMVTPEDVDETLQDEITEECQNFGSVNRVIIYQEKQSDAEDAPVIVKIFVEFSSPLEADKAKASLHNRFFAGRKVICDIYDLVLYRNDDLSG